MDPAAHLVYPGNKRVVEEELYDREFGSRSREEIWNRKIKSFGSIRVCWNSLSRGSREVA